MGDEIRQQPAAIERTLKAEWRHAVKLREYFQKNPVRMIVLAARGTSDNAAQFGRYLLEISTGIPVSLAAPSVTTLYGSKIDLKDSAVIVVSQSGESTDTNIVLEAAQAAGAFTIGITNEAESTLAKLAQHAFLVRRQRKECCGDQNLYRTTVVRLPAGVRVGRTDRAGRVAALSRLGSSGAGTGTGDSREGRALLLHAARRMRRQRFELCQLIRIRIKVDGDLLRGGGAFFVRRFAAWANRHARSIVPGILVLSGGGHVEINQ